jgi:1-acyl-sn-glycerol-3-phosphate acyltransferase
METPGPRLVVDHRVHEPGRSRWRSLAAYASTLATSGRIVGRAALGQLDERSMERRKHRWSQEMLSISQTSLGVDGREHVVPGQAYVLVSNHQSLLDPAVVLAAFPAPLSFVAKQELSRIPVFASALTALRVVFVDRKDPERARAQLEAAKVNVADGISMWIAAEGTRSKDGELGKLKKGGLHVALALGVPVLPTWIDGTGAVLPPDALGCRTGQTVWVVFGRPIPTEGLDRRALPDLSAATRAALLAGRERAAAIRRQS